MSKKTPSYQFRDYMQQIVNQVGDRPFSSKEVTVRQNGVVLTSLRVGAIMSHFAYNGYAKYQKKTKKWQILKPALQFLRQIQIKRRDIF